VWLGGRWQTGTGGGAERGASLAWVLRVSAPRRRSSSALCGLCDGSYAARLVVRLSCVHEGAGDGRLSFFPSCSTPLAPRPPLAVGAAKTIGAWPPPSGCHPWP